MASCPLPTHDADRIKASLGKNSPSEMWILLIPRNREGIKSFLFRLSAQLALKESPKLARASS